MNEKRDGNYVEQSKQMIRIQVCDKTQLLALREKYKEGTMVKLVEMIDNQAPEPGSLGIVRHIDDIGSIHCRWSNGSSLALIPGIDKFEICDGMDEENEKGCGSDECILR